MLVWSLGAAAACVYVAGRGGVVASSVATCVARGLRRGGASDGLRREFVAKVIVVDPYASEPPACHEGRARRSTTSTPSRRQGSDTHRRYLRGARATTRARRLKIMTLRVLRGEVELDQRHPQMILELLEIFDGTVLLPPALRVEGLEELRVDLI